MTPAKEPSRRFTLYCDEDSHSLALAESLLRAEMDVLRSTEAGMDGKSDREQLAFAASQGRVLYTRNAADFARLHVSQMSGQEHHFGLLLRSKANYSIGEQARRILNLWEALTAADMMDRMEFLSAWGGKGVLRRPR